jgi:carboxyl-terminal processing protease
MVETKVKALGFKNTTVTSERFMTYRRVVLTLLIGFISFLTGGWFLQGQSDEGRDVYQKARLFDQIVRYVAEYYVDSLEVNELYDMAIDGMFERLGDPYTSFLGPEAFGELSLNTTGNYAGIGARIDSRDGWVTVVSPVADSPADRAGLEPGDQIVEVEGQSTKGWNTQKAANLLRGEPGTPVKITVIRAGLPDSLRFTLIRARIHVNSVEGVMMFAPEIGYMRLTTVSSSSAGELREAVSDIREQGAKALILDLRNNPGGVLEQGVALADLFLDPAEVVVETRGRARGATRTYRAENADAWPAMPLVVLVNGGTASAAEILSGALQDHDRGIVIGTPTFGKGVAYLLIRLSDKEAVTVTSSRWYTPSGRSIQRSRVGIHDGAQVASAALSPPDSEQVYITDGGRVLKNGSGGIQPDIILTPDTLTDGERRFAEALGAGVPQYRNIMTRYALELKGRDAVTDRDFRVTGPMLEQIYNRLLQDGIDVNETEWAGGRDLVADQFGYELTRYIFGREEELRRRAMDDNTIQRAVELLGEVDTPAELIQLVAQN